MEDADASRLMIILAIATPLLAVLAWIVVGHAARNGGQTMAALMRRNIVILAVAGPASLIVWWIFNRWLTTIGSRSVAGYILAALAFVAAGFATGFFGRLRKRRADPSERPPLKR